MHMKLYRYTTNSEGVFSAGKRLLPKYLVDEANKTRAWLPKPVLSEGDYLFYLTEIGKEKYESTLLNTHKKYLENIQLDEVESNDLGKVVYEDDWQVVVNAKLS